MSELLATSPAEALAVVLGLVYVVLAARGNRWCWPVGGASAALLVWLSWQARLPMQAVLQAWYVAMAVHGWRRWSVPATAQPGWWPLSHHAIAIAAALLASVPITLLLRSQLSSDWPWLDSVTTVLSLVATWLTTRMRIESWLYWIAIDAVLAGLYAAQGLRATALLFVVYLGVSVVGLRSWLKLYRKLNSPG
ncbi:MAG: nicotinamide riboside transporter PnuC [Steroidobacteraceae bacterium]